MQKCFYASGHFGQNTIKAEIIPYQSGSHDAESVEGLNSLSMISTTTSRIISVEDKNSCVLMNEKEIGIRVIGGTHSHTALGNEKRIQA